jgi:hypothetical protein
MMVMMFGKCKTNTILMLLTRFVPFSLSTQVAILNGHYEATFGSIKLLFNWLVPTLQWKISLSIVAHIMELIMVVSNACLLTHHTYNWMMVCLTMKIITKIWLIRSTLLTLQGL